MAEDLTANHKIRTVSELMVSIEDEINAVKSGEINDSRARLIFRGRTLQLKAAEMYLAAARMESKLRPQLAQRMGGLVIDHKPAPEKIEPPTPEVAEPTGT